MSGTKRHYYRVGDWVRFLDNSSLIIAVVNYIDVRHNVEYLITDKGTISVSSVIECRQQTKALSE